LHPAVVVADVADRQGEVVEDDALLLGVFLSSRRAGISWRERR